MRIIGGYLKNKKIFFPTDKFTRPLKDMVRESIFNIIEHSTLIKCKIKNSNILDLFSGSGSFGFECMSRGAAKVHFCENYEPAVELLKKNILNFNCKNNSSLNNQKVIDFLENIEKFKIQYDIIFLDPPYREEKIKSLLELIFIKKIFKKNSLIILHRNKKTKDNFPDNFKVLTYRIYGISKIYFGTF